MKPLLAKNPVYREHEVARRALAYERIDYPRLLRAMIAKYFWGLLEAPPVVFRSLDNGHPATLLGTVDRKTRLVTNQHIVLDTFALANLLVPLRVPLTAVLAHELCHLFRQEINGLVGKHGRGFNNLCETVWDFCDCPVINGNGVYLKPAYEG